VREKIRSWYAASRRELPWRVDRDPYRVLVSETMLVQTTVTAVVPYFQRFLTRFPTVAALARAEEAEVIKAWEGLGYYRRARQLHAAARVIMEKHQGVIPDDPSALMALPGVGRYIAGAVLSFAFDQPAPIIEANTQRVVARWLAWPADLRATASQDRFWRAAQRLVPPEGSGEFNQAFMELGATVCTPRAPLCLVCPVAAECGARQAGLQDILPVAASKAPPLESVEACALVEREGRLVIVRRGEGGLWAGFWEFPTIHVSGADPAGRSLREGPVSLAAVVPRLTGVEVEIGRKVKSLTYSVTRYRVRLDAYQARGLSDSVMPGIGVTEVRWVRAEDLGNYPFSAAGRRLIGWLTDTREIRKGVS
jgi:A/G-specific adenine glycosylase